MTTYKPLTEIGVKHGTDKAYFHLFTEFYNDYFELFKNKPINILEIGIFEGKSILMLKEFFPLATIYAIDINPSRVNLKLGDNIHNYLCSQDDCEKLKLLFNNIKFDIIIDDGSHMTSHQQISLGFMFPYLNKKGIYICEDLHTSYTSNYIDTDVTTLKILETYCQDKKISCDIINIEQLDYLNNNIDNVFIYERNMNAISCWSCKQENISNNDNCLHCNTNLSPSTKSITSILIHK